MRLGPLRPGPIGLDIGERYVKAAQLVRHGGGWASYAGATIPRHRPGSALSPDEAQLIADVLQRRGFAGKRVALSAPEGAVVSSLLELPPANAQVPRDRVVRMEIARVHRLQPDRFTCCWSELPPADGGGTGAQALCWAVPFDRVEPMLLALDTAGLSAVGMEPPSLALHRGCAGMLPDRSRISAVADLGATAARLVLLYQGRIVHERALAEWGTDALTGALSEKWSSPGMLAERAMLRYGVAGGGGESTAMLAADTAGTLSGLLEDMLEQVSLSFSFVSHQYPDAELGPLLLTGGGAAIPGLAGALAQGLDLQVVPLTAGVLVEGWAAPAESPAVALGLAMEGGTPHV